MICFEIMKGLLIVYIIGVIVTFSSLIIEKIKENKIVTLLDLILSVVISLFSWIAIIILHYWEKLDGIIIWKKDC
ncbi:MAG: hypothetical protein DRP34_03665 [Thermodesulfobacteriota bacterium]|nr:MAG: hypothetical protein DRP34_03665 [Thermodesulfobacteriota bacterium]